MAEQTNDQILDQLGVYTIQAGDTIWDIANQFGMTPEEFLALPGNEYLQDRLVTNADGTQYILIHPGDIVSIPGMVEGEFSILDTLQSGYDRFASALTAALTDPLIIDMGNNGLQLNSWENSGVHFDLDGNGTSEESGWTVANGDDVFLAIDKNNNGNVDSIDELFGNENTPGFTALRAYDSNGDNKIDANDSQFNLLKIWKDSNANGVVDAGELTSLTDNGIQSISLQSVNSTQNIAGNLRLSYATVNFTDGSTRTIHEVAFGKDEFNSSIADPDEALGPDFELNINTILLPYSRGYGELHSWQVAMTLDSALLEMGQELASLDISQFSEIENKFAAFLFRWANVENATNEDIYTDIVPIAQPDADPRIVAFLEKITGLDMTRGTNVVTGTINAALANDNRLQPVKRKVPTPANDNHSAHRRAA